MSHWESFFQHHQNSKSIVVRLFKVYLFVIVAIFVFGLGLSAYSARSVPNFEVLASGPGVINDVACLEGETQILDCDVELFFDSRNQIVYDLDRLVNSEPVFWQIVCVGDGLSGVGASQHEWTNVQDGASFDVFNPGRPFDISLGLYQTPITNFEPDNGNSTCGLFNFALRLTEPELQILSESSTSFRSNYILDRTVIFDIPKGRTVINFQEFGVANPVRSEIMPIEEALEFITIDSLREERNIDTGTIWLVIFGISSFILLTSIFPFRIARKLEETLKKDIESRKFYIEVSPDPLAMLDENGRILLASNSLKEFSGADNLEGKKISDLFIDFNENNFDIKNLMINSRPLSGSDGRKLFVNADFGVLPVDINLNRINFFGRDVAMIRIADATDSIKARQAMVIEAQRDHALLISRALHHETNRSVTKLAQWFPIWLETKENNSEYSKLAEKYVNEAIEELPQAIKTTTALSLLGVSQYLPKEELKKITIEDLCLSWPSLGVEISCHGKGTIFGSLDLLLLAIRNIIKNSKIHGRAKKITLCLEFDSEINKTVLSIKDDGMGSSQLSASAALQAGARASGNGEGKGLKIMQRVISAHQAELEVFAEQGYGWEFKIYFPRYEDLN